MWWPSLHVLSVLDCFEPALPLVVLEVSDELPPPVLGHSDVLLVHEHGIPVIDIREGGGTCHDGLGGDRRVGVKHWRDLVRVFVDCALHV